MTDLDEMTDLDARKALCLAPMICPQCDTAVYSTRRWGAVEVSTGDLHRHAEASR